MAINNVSDYVIKLTESAFGKKELSEIDYIFGYAKLVLMDSAVIEALFTEDADRADIDRVRSVFSLKKIDPELIKSGIPLLRTRRSNTEPSIDVPALFNSDLKASDVLAKLLETNIPELKVMQEGKSIDDVLKLANSEMPAASKAKKESKEKNESKSSPKRSKVTYFPLDDPKKADKETEDKPAEKTAEKSDKERFDELVIKTSNLYQSLKHKVFGQDEAIRLFADGYFQSRIFDCEEVEKKGPSATFLFAGPPGVGKTLLASSVAEILDMPFLRLDMSEFSKEDSVQRLCGVPKTFRSPKPGVLTEFVNVNPVSIVLLDEIEKAHIDVIYQFLQILDGGSLTDDFTLKTVDFNNVILIFTTNVGKKLYEDPSRHNLSAIPRSIVMKEIENEENERGLQVFPSAICSRFASGNVIMFNRLGINNHIDIINGRFKDASNLVKKLYGYELNIDSKVAPMLLFSQSTHMDARNMSSQSTILIKNELYDLGLQSINRAKPLKSVDTIRMKVHIDPKEDTYIDSLFVNRDKTIILFVGERTEFPKKIKDILVGFKYEIIFSDKDHVLEDVAKNDISFVLINMKYDASDNKEGYLSLDDVKNNAVVSFDLISKKVPDLPVFILHKQEITDTDAASFLERGAREFIKWDSDVTFINNIKRISDMVYMQKRVDELSSRGRVLTYNSAQQIEDNVATITFYDLKVEVAADADEDKLLLSDNERPTDRFDDVIGAENAKSELKYFVDYLKNPKKYMAQSIKPPKGVLLYGPPGTGKTMLARAMAGESDVSFIPFTATGFLNKYIGEGEKTVRQLFSVAKKFAPSIIFIDEIDAIGKTRTGSTSTHHTESLLNALLTEMDGFEFDPSKPVFVVAATNYGLGSSSEIGDGIDPALIRRFDNKIYVDLPKEKEREKYLNLMLDKAGIKKVPATVIHNMAQRTTGQSLAILKNIIELALRNANKNGVEVDGDILLNSFEEYMYGEKHEWDEEYYQMVAIHEAGHAFISYLSGAKPSFVTIVSRGDFGGYMQNESSEKHPSYSREELLWKIRVALAGRAAETVFFGEKGINTGIGSDIRSATNIAWEYIYSYAMSDNMSCIPTKDILASPVGADAIFNVNELLKSEMDLTERLAMGGKKYIKKLADYLVKNNQATEAEIVKIFSKANLTDILTSCFE